MHVYIYGFFFFLRDLLKWCDRISVNFDGTSSATAQHVFQEVSRDLSRSCSNNLEFRRCFPVSVLYFGDFLYGVPPHLSVNHYGTKSYSMTNGFLG